MGGVINRSTPIHWSWGRKNKHLKNGYNTGPLRVMRVLIVVVFEELVPLKEQLLSVKERGCVDSPHFLLM